MFLIEQKHIVTFYYTHTMILVDMILHNVFEQVVDIFSFYSSNNLNKIKCMSSVCDSDLLKISGSIEYLKYI